MAVTIRVDLASTQPLLIDHRASTGDDFVEAAHANPLASVRVTNALRDENTVLSP